MQRHGSWRGRHQLTGRGCVLPYMISSVSETAKHPQSTTSARERASTVFALNGRPGVLQLVKKRSAPSCLCARALQRPNAYFKHWTALPNVIIAAQQHAWSQERRRRWSPPPRCHSGSGGSRQRPLSHPSNHHRTFAPPPNTPLDVFAESLLPLSIDCPCVVPNRPSFFVPLFCAPLVSQPQRLPAPSQMLLQTRAGPARHIPSSPRRYHTLCGMPAMPNVEWRAVADVLSRTESPRSSSHDQIHLQSSCCI